MLMSTPSAVNSESPRSVRFVYFLPGAIAKLKEAVSLSQGCSIEHSWGAYALAGEKRKALEILDELKALSQQRYVSPFDLAVAQVGLDDPTALQSFEEAYQRHVFRIIELNRAHV